MPPRRKKIRKSIVWTQINNELDLFLKQDCKRLSKKLGRKITRPDIIRALLVAYYEKRAIGLLLDPDD